MITLPLKEKEILEEIPRFEEWFNAKWKREVALSAEAEGVRKILLQKHADNTYVDYDIKRMFAYWLIRVTLRKVKFDPTNPFFQLKKSTFSPLINLNLFFNSEDFIFDTDDTTTFKEVYLADFTKDSEN